MPALRPLRLSRSLAFLLALAITACATTSSPSPSSPSLLPSVDVLLLGEQHDAPEHQRRHRAAIELLARQHRLAALVLEMAEQGASTSALPASAEEGAVRMALQWDERAWPWAAYGPAVMAAVRAGVPVLGANLPRAHMRVAMADAALDARLDNSALQLQHQAIREGHCGMLPETQIAPMARIQIARDRAMAQTIAAAQVEGRTVALIAGAGHVDPQLGVPRHLPPTLRVQVVRHPADPGAPQKDYCAELRQQLPAKR